MPNHKLNIGLTEEDIEQLSNGETVTYTAPDLVHNGYNTDINIEPADMENLIKYRNDYQLRKRE